MDGTILLVIILYTAWAIYSGRKFVRNHGWFSEPGTANTVGRAIVSLLMGYLIGGFTLVLGAVKLGIRIASGR